MKIQDKNGNAPRLTPEEAIFIAEATLREVLAPFDSVEGFRAHWRGLDLDAPGYEGKPLRLWSVAYQTPGDFFDPEPRFLDINDDTGEPLYIMTGTGHIPLV